MKYSDLNIDTARRMEAFIEAIASGLPEAYALKYAFISKGEMEEFVKRGLEHKGDGYEAFLKDYYKTDATNVNELLGLIRKAANKNENYWTASAWLLERTAPETFGVKKQVALDTDTKPEITIVNNLKKEGE